MTTGTTQVDKLYISCATNTNDHFVRATAYTPGEADAAVDNAETGRRLAPVSVHRFHDTIRTSRGRLRRTGYAPHPDGVPQWTERLTWGAGRSTLPL
ncbi:hypothetical protein ACFY2K_43145 [Kitasatospora sp. NPDC001309]|uniref:hypothetical protein n=1 Tax=Kitasatospora sp. NPDC001309 TaxID=3364013 RepID=UPI0036B41369